MKKLIKICCIGLITICNCTKDNSGGGGLKNNYKFPLKVGNEWQYERTVEVNFYSSMTTQRIDSTWTLKETYIVKVEDTVKLNDTLTTYKVSSAEINDKYKSYEFCTNNINGLFCNAYYNSGDPAELKSLRKLKQYFNTSHFILFPIYYTNKKLTPKEDTLFYDNPPATILKYPLKLNNKWILRSNNAFTVYKTFTNYENVESMNQVFNCYKIEYTYSDDSGIDVSFVDYVSSIGLISRIFVQNRIELSDINGSPTNVYAELQEKLMLNNYKLRK